MLHHVEPPQTFGVEKNLRRIALCDDDPVFLQELQGMVATLLPAQAEIACYHNGLDLLHDSRRLPPHLLFLDIRMPGVDGLETARALREIQPRLPIVLVTHYREFAVAGFEVRAFDYLVKPVNRLRLQHIIEELQDYGLAKERCFYVFNKTKVYLPPLEDLLYFESQGRRVRAQAAREQYSWYGKLSQLEGQLTPAFVKIHRSFIINLAHIKEVDKRQRLVLMKNGQWLAISQSCYATFMAEVEQWK